MSRRPGRVSPATLFFAVVSLVLGAALLWLYWKTPPPVSPPSPPRVSASPRPRVAPAPRPRAAVSPHHALAPIPGRTPARIAIVIDDLGNDREAVERIASWPYPVAGAVLPELPGSAPAALALVRSGKEVLLHLPMEPHGFPLVRPGPGVVLRSQSDGEIAQTLADDLETVPGARGVNNHMGSAATADPRVMRIVADVLARRRLFFVDSRTTGSTVAREAAERALVPSVSRRVFLDDVATPDAVERSFQELLRRAREEGEALAIGHPHPATLAVLERELARLPAERVRLVPVSELVR